MPILDQTTADEFWADYRGRYQSGLADAEKGNLEAFDRIFFENPIASARSLSPAACRSALFIMLYRGFPLLQLPYQVLHQLLEIDEQLSTWRYRHMSMVHRTIGTRIGTGGSTGRDYLASALERHHLFREIAALTSFLIQRKGLPELASAIRRSLGFTAS
jgi:tryptophan 2,3-dioxygenase